MDGDGRGGRAAASATEACKANQSGYEKFYKKKSTRK